MSLEVRTTASDALGDAQQVVVAVVGSTVIAVGVVLIVVPVSATIVIPAGVAILAAEFVWARRLLGRLKNDARRLLGVSRAS